MVEFLSFASSGAGQQVMSILWLVFAFLEIGLAIGVVLLVTKFAWPILMWPYIIPIYGYRNGVLKFIRTDRGRIILDKGVEKLRLWKARRFLEPPANEFKIAFTKRKDVIPFFVDNSGNYTPMKIMPEGKLLMPNDKDLDFWFVQEINKNNADYAKHNKLLEWLPLLASATFLVFIFVFMLILNKQMGELVSQIGNLVSALVAAT